MTSSVCVVADGLHLVEPDLLAGVEDERGDLSHHLSFLLPHPVKDLRRFPGQLLQQMLQSFCVYFAIYIKVAPITLKGPKLEIFVAEFFYTIHACMSK